MFVKIEFECEKLLKALIIAGEAAKNIQTGKDSRILDAEGLFVKFIEHVCSTFYLFRGTKIQEFTIDFIDNGSINVLGRSAIETFLVFHYVFVEPTTEAEKDFRYWSWVLGGLMDRQKYPTKFQHTKEKKIREKTIIADIKQKLRDNSVFKTLSDEVKKGIIKEGKWRLKSWSKIALSAGLSKIHAKHFYNYLCGYAHSGSLSILQIRQAYSLDIQKKLAETTCKVILIAIAFMIKSYGFIFPQSNDALKMNSELSEVIQKWINIGKHSI